jgi:hypothetical protein
MPGPDMGNVSDDDEFNNALEISNTDDDDGDGEEWDGYGIRRSGERGRADRGVGV